MFCTKYRRKVLQNGVDETCKYILWELSKSMEFIIFAMEVMPDHIHLLVDVKPSFKIPKAMQKIMGSLSRALFVMHSEIKQKLWGGNLWNPTYCIVTVSDRSLQIVERYIANQKLK